MTIEKDLLAINKELKILSKKIAKMIMSVGKAEKVKPKTVRVTRNTNKGVLCLGWRWLGGDSVIFANSERIEALFCKSKAVGKYLKVNNSA